jgi:hypothetical protein
MNEEDALQEYVNWLVEKGQLRRGVDALGNTTYTPTDKLFTDNPEFAQELNKMVGAAIFSLWQKEFIEIEFFDEGFAIDPLPNPEKFNQIDELSDFEKSILQSIQITVMEKNDE